MKQNTETPLPLTTEQLEAVKESLFLKDLLNKAKASMRQIADKVDILQEKFNQHQSTK
jgi:hypothetical protein